MTPASADLHSDRVPLSRTEIVLIFAFWTFVALLTAANGALDPRGRAMQSPLLSPPVVLGFVQAGIWAVLTPLIFWMTSRLTIERANAVARVALLLAIGIVAAMLVDSVLAWMRFEVFDFGRRPRGGFRPGMAVRRMFWLDDLIIYFAVVAGGFARDYFGRYRARREESLRLRAEAVQLQAQSAQLQAQLADARLSALRTQLNPHFLFNTLNAISTLVERDPRGVRRMIARLSELLRYSLATANDQEVPLERELEFVERYLEIMQVRFDGKLEVRTDIEPGVRDALVPTLLLQTLVENAVKHGIDRLKSGGRIAIGARHVGEQLVIHVSDNGPGVDAAMRAAGERQGVGLRNTRARLGQLYGDAYRLTLESAGEGGTVVSVTVPFHTAADLRTTGGPARQLVDAP